MPASARVVLGSIVLRASYAVLARHHALDHQHQRHQPPAAYCQRCWRSSCCARLDARVRRPGVLQPRHRRLKIVGRQPRRIRLARIDVDGNRAAAARRAVPARYRDDAGRLFDAGRRVGDDSTRTRARGRPPDNASTSCRNGTNVACSGKSFQRLSRSDARTSARPSPAGHSTSAAFAGREPRQRLAAAAADRARPVETSPVRASPPSPANALKHRMAHVGRRQRARRSAWRPVRRRHAQASIPPEDVGDDVAVDLGSGGDQQAAAAAHVRRRALRVRGDRVRASTAAATAACARERSSPSATTAARR